MEATHYWTGIKPHRRQLPGRGNAYHPIHFGQAFTPSAAELVAFGDKLRPVSEGPPSPPVPDARSPIPGGQLLGRR